MFTPEQLTEMRKAGESRVEKENQKIVRQIEAKAKALIETLMADAENEASRGGNSCYLQLHHGPENELAVKLLKVAGHNVDLTSWPSIDGRGPIRETITLMWE